MKKIFLILFLIILSFFLTKEMKAGSEHNVSGWAWSENIGWISFNCNNPELPAPRCANNYGVHINPSTGIFSGYAWSENIGWITFNSGELTGCPSGTCEARLDLTAGGTYCGAQYRVCGWAKALTDGGGWDGWIRLSDTNYGISWNPSTQEMEGWAWSDMVIGWISFNCKNTGVCATSNYKVIAQLDTTPPTTQIKVKRKSTGEDLTAAGSWLRADTYIIEFEDHDQAEGSGSNCQNCSCEYSIYLCKVGGPTCGDPPCCATPVIDTTSRNCNSSIQIIAGTSPYNNEGVGRYQIYSGAKDMAGNSASEYRYINFDFTPPLIEIK